MNVFQKAAFEIRRFKNDESSKKDEPVRKF
jgi:hypothetical protein